MGYEAWILITGSLVGVTCGVVGSFLLLRKMSMLADAISHSVLLGIVLAFLISQSLNGLYMLIGAAIAGIATAFFVQLFQSKGIQEDASIGVVFTSMFALGVILVSLYASDVHLDVEHVLMGEIAFVPWNTVDLALFGEVPKSFVLLVVVLLLDALLIFLLYKEFKITSFDESMAAALGIPVLFIHYILMGMVSITTVAAFDAVGAILVVAFLIAPGASAYLLTDKFIVMLVLAAIIGCVDAVTGYYLAYFLDVSIAGAMAVMAGVIFALCFIFGPQHGLLSKWLRKRKVAESTI
ncbi:iron ABC transporter [Bacillus coahuilensis m2-6]|uniref:Iron ABC transporter n=1 Tax=Bacillus coahuilensis p1.1.43 TaxID=1150625 RepID=A0A147K8H9_9BACI|nr:metal ABC transporter permease [Bacillus coahuilensis]KUP06509.1 iron ABC transporter [Bacillus coahuilensis p1.1.43]KUP07994.1 iron ABC transporter [Bacillus coahuilensis m2-6]